MVEKEKTRDSLDFIAALKTAEMAGVKRGRQEAKIEIAKKMKEQSFSFTNIAQVTGLSISEIENL